MNKQEQSDSSDNILQPADIHQSVNTQGGTYISGSVDTVGGDFIGRDKNINVVQKIIQYINLHPAVLYLILLISFFTLVTVTFVLYYIIPTPIPMRMTGDFRIAVASFVTIGDSDNSQLTQDLNFKKEVGTELGEGFYLHLQQIFEKLNLDFAVSIWGPDQVGSVEGQNAGERANSSAQIAKKIGADVVVYGIVDVTSTTWQVTPEFYVAGENFYEAEEITGQHELGLPLFVTGQGNVVDRIEVSSELTSRTQVLSHIAIGLAYYSVHDFEKALTNFQSAEKIEGWEDNEGRQVLYLLMGNAAARAALLDQAQEAYQATIKLEPNYARGYAGLGSVAYLRSLENVNSEHFEPDLDDLDLAIKYFNQALEASNQPPTADIPTKVALGLGQVYLAQWFSGEGTLPQAIEQFELVIEYYDNGKNPHVQEFASEAYARLGLIDQQKKNIDLALQKFTTAMHLSTNPSRRGLYWATLANLYKTQGKNTESADANRSAIEQYQMALSLTVQDKQLAVYWVAIATRYEHLGETSEAIKALENAVNLLPKESEERTRYQSYIKELRLLR